MATMAHGASAQIYQFPVKGRAGSYARSIAGMDAAAQRLPRMDYGSGWYHDAAIRESEQPRKS